MTEVYAEWKKLRDNVKSASARLYLEKNENTESKYDEALERLGQFEKENGIPLMADEAKVKKMFCPQTNEQWLCSLSTEEKATFLINATMFYDCGETLHFVGALRKASESDFKPYKWLHKDVVEWLKEKRHEMQKV